MLISAPVYSNESGSHFICIYSEDEDGTFRRTQNEPLRMLRNDIQGISSSQGELVSKHYDRYTREWNTPTVTYHYGRPQSFYQFLREKLARNKFFVFSKPVLSGHISKFTVHELQLKSGVSQRKVSILKEKYCESVQLWLEEEYQAQKLSSDPTVVYRDNRRVEVSTVPEAEVAASENTVINERTRRNLVQTFSLDSPEKKKPNTDSTEHFYQRFVIDLD